MRDQVTTVAGKTITVKDTINFLKLNGTFRHAVYKLIENEVILKEAKKLKIKEKPQELEQFIEQKRRLAGLHTALDVNRYCRMNGIMWEQWKALARLDYLRIKIKEHFAKKEHIRNYFEAHRDDLKMICVARIVHEDMKMLEKIYQDIQDKKINFSKAARQHSQEHTTRIAGGYLGCVARGALPPEIESALFNQPVNHVSGPFLQNNVWMLYKVMETIHPEFNQQQKDRIINKLFISWLHDKVIHMEK
ncbi:peptidylprolyl isomerase [Magnetococcales bacterium HHB-1]